VVNATASGILIVVGRDQADLYEYFRWGFGQTPGVEIVMDRRLGERRDRRDGQGPPEDLARPIGGGSPPAPSCSRAAS